MHENVWICPYDLMSESGWTTYSFKQNSEKPKSWTCPCQTVSNPEAKDSVKEYVFSKTVHKFLTGYKIKGLTFWATVRRVTLCQNIFLSLFFLVHKKHPLWLLMVFKDTLHISLFPLANCSYWFQLSQSINPINSPSPTVTMTIAITTQSQDFLY